MKDNFSKRRFYLNKRDKNNSYKKTENNDNLNIKTEYNVNNNKKEIRNFKPILDNKTNSDKKYFGNEFRKKKTNLNSEENGLKNNQNEKIVKNINYFTFSLHNEFLFGDNNYINANNKINYNFQPKQENNINKIYTRHNYNKSFESIKVEPKRYFERYNKDKINSNYYKDNSNLKNEKNIPNIKFIKNPSNEKVKNDYKWRYHFANKKKEIIKIQSIWRGYYFRKIKIEYTLSVFVKNIKKILNKKLKKLSTEFLNLLKNIKKKENDKENDKYKFRKSYKINITEKYKSDKRPLFYNETNFKNIISSDKKANKNEISNEFIKKNNKYNKYNHNSYNSYKSENKEKINKIFVKKIFEKNKNDIDDGIFNNPIKIIYVPKKASNNNNRYYYLKRVTRIKKIKLESFVKFIKKKFYKIYFNILKNKYKISSKLYKIKTLFFVIDSILRNHLKKYLTIYREKILDKKVKEEIKKKKTLTLLKEENENIQIKLFKNKRILKENKIEKNSPVKLKRNLDKNIKVSFKNQKDIINDIIFENINESDNEEENKNQKNYFKYKRRNKEKSYKLLNKIVMKKVEINYRLLNKYFNQWKNLNIFNRNKQKIKLRNMHSPDIEIRGNKKRHIKIKYSRALTSKTSLSSIKSEGRSNTSGNFYIKKMRVRNIIVNSNNYSTIKYKTENNYNKDIKLSNIIYMIDNKNIITKYFKYWKKMKL